MKRSKNIIITCLSILFFLVGCNLDSEETLVVSDQYDVFDLERFDSVSSNSIEGLWAFSTTSSDDNETKSANSFRYGIIETRDDSIVLTNCGLSEKESFTKTQDGYQYLYVLDHSAFGYLVRTTINIIDVNNGKLNYTSTSEVVDLSGDKETVSNTFRETGKAVKLSNSASFLMDDSSNVKISKLIYDGQGYIPNPKSFKLRCYSYSTSKNKYFSEGNVYLNKSETVNLESVANDSSLYFSRISSSETKELDQSGEIDPMGLHETNKFFEGFYSNNSKVIRFSVDKISSSEPENIRSEYDGEILLTSKSIDLNAVVDKMFEHSWNCEGVNNAREWDKCSMERFSQSTLELDISVSMEFLK